MEEEVKVVEEEPKKVKNGKPVWKKVLNIILWIVLLCWIGICFYDFINVQNKKEPKFCIKEEVNKYSDGNVKICLGLGYKVINYQRSSYRAIEFGPFWITDSTSDKK